MACILTLGCVSTLCAPAKPAVAQDGTSAVTEADQRALQQLTGSWLTSYEVGGFTTKVPVLLTFHDDRTVLESDSPTSNPLFNPPVALSNGQGAWKPARGTREYTFIYRKLLFDEAASTPAGSTSTLGRLALGADGLTFRATIEITFYDTDNKITRVASGVVTGTRIVVPAAQD